MKVDPMKERVQTLLARVAYKTGAGFHVSEKAPGVVMLQHWQIQTHALTGARSYQYGRKFYCSPHATDEELLQTALAAVLMFEEHEARERFRFDGERPFHPHKSLAALLAPGIAERS